MKQTDNSLDSIRKNSLKKEFQKQDKRFDSIDKRFEAIEKRFEFMEKSLRVEIKFSILGATHRIEEKIKDSQNLLLTTIDPLLKELEERREDREIGAYQTAELRKNVDDHEKRITRLEKVPQTV